MNALRIFAVLAAVSALVLAAFEPDYGVSVWQTDRGLPQNAANALAQTDDGFLWVATWNGLARVDGQGVTTYHRAAHAGQPSDRIRQVWAQGNDVWLSAGRAGLARLRDGVWQAIPFAAGATEGAREVAFAPDGGVWVARGSAGLAHLPPGTTDWVLHPLPTGNAQQVAVDGADNLLVADGERGLWLGHRAAADGFTPLNAGAVVDLAAANDDGFWVLGAHELWRLTGNELRRHARLPAGVTASVLASGPSGELWVGTVQNGVWRIGADGSRRHWTTAQGLPSNAVRSLLVDQEGTTWVGTDNAGLAQLTPAPFAELHNGEWGRVQSVAIDPKGTVLMASLQAGLVQRHVDGTVAVGGEGPLGESLISVAVDHTGRRWLGGFDGRVWQETAAGWREHELFTDQRDARVYNLLVDRRGAVWATGYAGLARWQDGDWQRWDEGMRWLRGISEGPDGAIWLRSRGRGLLRVRDDVVEVVATDAELARDTGFTLHLDRRGNVWMGSFGGGVDLWRDGELHHVGEAQGLPDDMAMSFADDPAGFLWIGSGRGVFRVAIDELVAVALGEQDRVDGINYGRADGLDQLEFPGGFGPLSATAPDGAIWMATLSGAIRLDPQITHSGIQAEASPIHLLAAQVDDRQLRSDRLELQPGERRLRMVAQVVGLRAPEKTRLRHRLRGFEANWTTSATRAEATYTNLPPGDFVWEVQGRNGMGAWSEVQSLAHIQMLPVWWQRRPWQMLIVLVTLLGSAALGRWWTARRLRWRLEQAEREQALTRERERIARDIHDILGANLARLRHLGARVGARTEDAADDLKRVENLCDESLDNLRELVWTTDPKCDTVVSTVDFLEQQIGEVARECGLRVKFEISPDLPDLVLDATRRHGLLLLVRESLANVLKHARASLLTFRCRWDASRLHIDVLDDGRGFNPKNPGAGGHGLANLVTRARAMGATCEVRSEPDAGTAVAITLPLVT